MCGATNEDINVEQLSGAHPHLNVVQDIAIHPLARLSLDEAAGLLKKLQQIEIIPFYQYAAIHTTRRALDTIRGELGYYRPNFKGIHWAEWAQPEQITMKPDEGLEVVTQARGIAMIGTRPLLTTYNITIISMDLLAAFHWSQTKLELIVSRTTLRHWHPKNVWTWRKEYLLIFS
ncbi:uncharacterized protein LOC132637854 [Lycium barbarum]|uniref:uncharacterized protein LOC132637854 n=1 Tax=Lycium barbarum TaxID=112863 RepID=UPI00293F68AA|nr:uncharacterized protein LOC132637854 [Lycium barbarum]